MAEVLLINPSRRKGRKMARRKTRSAAQKAATRRMIAANRSRSGGTSRKRVRRKSRRSNPINTIAARRRMHMRRINPATRRRASRRGSRRRSNPISLGGVTPKSIVSAIKDAVIGAGGAVAVDMLYNRINPMLPASLQKGPSIGAGDGVKALLTIVLGRVLSRATRGLSVKAAQGSLTVQAHQIITGLLPAGVVGYYSPARITQGTQRVGPSRSSQGALNAYVARGSATPLLNGTAAYVRGRGPLLSGAREREGITSMR